MPAATIELDCPGCVEELELDAGFAGGVARCSNCGTLMTVPADRHARPERLVRPERPGAPARASQPQPQTRPQRPVTPATPATPAADRPAAPTAPPAPAAEQLPEVTQASADEAGVYTTESGKTVRIEQGSRIATARQRRTGVRITTGIVFGGVVLLLVGVCIWASYMLIQSMNAPTDTGLGQLAVQTFGYDRNRNPYDIDEPNLLGLAIRDNTVVVVDTGRSGDWLEPFKRAAATGLTRGGSDAGFGLIYAVPGEPVSYDTRLRRLSSLSASSLEGVQGDVKASNQAVDASPALRLAAGLEPEAIIFVTGTKLDKKEREVLEEVTRGRRLDVLVIAAGFPPMDATDLARERGGVADAILTPQQLMDWEAAGND